MANAMYDLGRGHFLEGDIVYSADNIKLILYDENDDALNIATDEDLADILAAARVATSGNFTSKTSTNGVADAEDVTLSSVTGDEFESITVYKDSGVEGTSWLMVNLDTTSDSSLPATPGGGDINVNWDNGANKIFKL